MRLYLNALHFTINVWFVYTKYSTQICISVFSMITNAKMLQYSALWKCDKSSRYRFKDINQIYSHISTNLLFLDRTLNKAES